MATAPVLEVDNSGMLALIDVPNVERPTLSQQVSLILTDKPSGDKFYDRIKAETDAFVADVSTKKGRDECIAKATKVTKTKTTIDRESKVLTEEARKFTASINAARKPMLERLDALAEDVRRPVTEWEAAEKARVAECDRILEFLGTASTVTIDETSEQIFARGLEIRATVIDAAQFGDRYEMATAAKADAGKRLYASYQQVKQREEQAAELAALQAEKAERDAREAAEREARELAERAEQEAEAARQHEIAERERIAEDRRIAAEKAAQDARDEEARKAQAERDRIQAEHEAALKVEREAREKVERDAAVAEELRQAAIRREQREKEQAEVARQRAEEARQADEANKVLQRRLKTEAKEAIMSCGVSEDAAQKLVLAIRAREIPHVVWSAQTTGQEG